uniref:Uncharacterized protein n=1 Tax=Amphimedon queenslandica TaxID=400682 RepID=A0A1X7V353_AMPQE
MASMLHKINTCTLYMYTVDNLIDS